MNLVSVVVPVRRDAASLTTLLAQLPAQRDVEIIVATAGFGEHEVEGLRGQRPDVTFVESSVGRGAQLNAGAARASGEWLWFLHADSNLPEGWLDTFRAFSASDTAIVGGSFRFALGSDAWQARVIERAVAARVRWLNLPYGDQGIFVRRTVFHSMRGFRELPLMEDVEFIGRLKRLGRLRHLRLNVTTSARRWEDDGWWRRSAGNLLILGLYWLGVSPDRLARRYYREDPLRPLDEAQGLAEQRRGATR